jgi:RES domain-containing protein
LAKERWASLDGIGGLKRAGRWHVDRRIVYTADCPALAFMEVIVNLDIDLDLLPDDYVLLKIEIPDGVVVEKPEASDLPAGWNMPESSVSRAIGTAWLDSQRSAVLKVPSAVIPHHHNLLINPLHADAQRIAIIDKEPFPFDDRVFDLVAKAREA